MKKQGIEGLEQYKRFIDGLITVCKRSVLARWIREYGTPEPKPYCTPDTFNRKMEMFTSEQRQMIAEFAQEAYEDGVFDTVVFLDESYELSVRERESESSSDYKLIKLPVEPLGYEMHDDLVNRRLGYAWTDEAKNHP